MKYFLILALALNTCVFAQKTAAQMEQEVATMSDAKEIMVIPPQQRAQDFKEAFDYLKKIQTQSKITFILKDSTKISQILDVSVLPGGTMLNFKINSTQGIQYQIIRVEDIKSIHLS
jgi:hypothetical protein